MLAKDDVSSLLKVLDSLSGELSAQRDEINGLCRAADRIGGVEALDVPKLETELSQQLALSQASMKTLASATSHLESLMGQLRLFSHAQTVKTLSLHAECSAQVLAMQERTDALWTEQVELERQAQVLDGKMAHAVSGLL